VPQARYRGQNHFSEEDPPNPEKKMSDQRRTALLSISLFAALASCLNGCSRKASNSYQGYVEGKFVYVASPQPGRLDHLSVARGDTITVGKALFTLDPEPELSAEAQARELLLSEEARLADLQTGKRPPERDVISAQLAQAKVEHQKAADILKSDEAQYAAGGLPLTDLIAARAAVEANAAQVRRFQSDLEVAELPGRDAQVKAQAQVVAANRAALQQATWKLQQKQVAASRNGLVFDTVYREGEWVSAGSPIVQMLPPENIEIRFFVPEPSAGKLHIGQNITLLIDGRDDRVSASITFISTQVEYTPPVIYSDENRAKLMFMVIAKPAADQAATLHPGQPVQVTLP
jgi:HlyD family secretion protein